MTANWIDRAIGYVSPVVAARRARARAYLDLVARRYDAAGGSRATYGWLTPATSRCQSSGPEPVISRATIRMPPKPSRRWSTTRSGRE
jgi:hypothetical protein